MCWSAFTKLSYELIKRENWGALLTKLLSYGGIRTAFEGSGGIGDV